MTGRIASVKQWNYLARRITSPWATTTSLRERQWRLETARKPWRAVFACPERSRGMTVRLSSKSPDSKFHRGASRIGRPPIFTITRKAHAPGQIIESWVQMQRLKFRRHREEDQAAVATLVRLFQTSECLFVLSQCRVYDCQLDYQIFAVFRAVQHIAQDGFGFAPLTGKDICSCDCRCRPDIPFTDGQGVLKL